MCRQSVGKFVKVQQQTPKPVVQNTTGNPAVSSEKIPFHSIDIRAGNWHDTANTRKVDAILHCSLRKKVTDLDSDIERRFLMTVVADFVTILTEEKLVGTTGDTPVHIGDADAGFGTGGALDRRPWMLMLSAKDMSSSGSASVNINGESIGRIFPTPQGGVWSVQTIPVPGLVINPGHANNHLTLTYVTEQFSIKNVFLFFHQEA